MKWIKASERLPEPGAVVNGKIICLNNKPVSLTFIKGEFHNSYSPDVYSMDNVLWLDESPDSEAVEFHEWVGKKGYRLSHYAAQGEAVHLHESAGSTPFHELRNGDWRTTKELYQLFKSQP